MHNAYIRAYRLRSTHARRARKDAGKMYPMIYTVHVHCELWTLLPRIVYVIINLFITLLQIFLIVSAEFDKKYHGTLIITTEYSTYQVNYLQTCPLISYTVFHKI